jgi:hypothetical protein
VNAEVPVPVVTFALPPAPPPDAKAVFRDAPLTNINCEFDVYAVPLAPPNAPPYPPVAMYPLKLEEEPFGLA